MAAFPTPLITNKTQMTSDSLLGSLRGCQDVCALRCALYAMCSRFGSIRQLDILDSGQRGVRQAMCFLQMDSVEQEDMLARELGIGRFGGELVLVVDLPNRPAANDVVLAPATAQAA